MLDGVTVVDLTDEAGWLAGRILADLSARVTLVEPPGGQAGRTTLPHRFAAQNAGKRSAVLDDEQTARLVARADVVLETGLTDRFERWAVARTVWCAITPWGRTGPRAHDPASDLSVQAASGVTWMTGDPDRAPVPCTFPTSSYHGCADAAAGVVMALVQRERTRRGQLVDVSLQEAHALATMSRIGQFALTGQRGRRAGALMRVGDTTQREIWPCADGHVTFGLRGGPARIPGLKRLVAWMSEEGFATAALTERDWDAYSHTLLAQPEVDAISRPIARFFATKTMTELYEAALTRGLMLAPANTAREILSSPQAAARGFFADIGRYRLPRAFVRSDAVAGVTRGAPVIGEHTVEVLAEL